MFKLGDEVESAGRLLRFVQAMGTIEPGDFVLVHNFLHKAERYQAGVCPPKDALIGVCNSAATVYDRNYFWAIIKGEYEVPVTWTKPKGNYIIGADYAAGCQPMSAPDYFPRASLLIREGPKAWIISEFRGGWPVIPEHPVKWNQVLFDSAEVRCIPPEEWDALGLKPSAVSLFGSPVELYETHATNNGPVNYWFVESVE